MQRTDGGTKGTLEGMIQHRRLEVCGDGVEQRLTHVLTGSNQWRLLFNAHS